MTLKKETREFLERNHLSEDQFKQSKFTWEELIAIKEDYESRQESFNEAAEIIAKRLQACSASHSVRWRIKDPEHLLAKLIRKRCEDNSKPKYQSITAENYMQAVTDLVGVRVLHLFKGDWIDVDAFIRKHWDIENDEPVIGYIRDGDNTIKSEYESAGNIIHEVHEKGYRSIHYIIRSSPTKDTVLCEVQTRTLFEEAWSEIDHIVRYPSFSDDENLGFILTIFNQLAGSADELGTYVRNLTKFIELYQQLEFKAQEDAKKRADEDKEKDEKLKKIITDLQKEGQLSPSAKKKLTDLQAVFDQKQEASSPRGLNVLDYKIPGLEHWMEAGTIDQIKKAQAILQGVRVGNAFAGIDMSHWEGFMKNYNEGLAKAMATNNPNVRNAINTKAKKDED